MTSKMSILVCYFIASILMGILCGVHGSSFHQQQPVLTIKTENGQEFDCVDFYKQPTFNNPLMKNHMHEVNITSLQSQEGEPKNLALKNGCPLGTVPILRSFYDLKSSIVEPNEGENCIASLRTTEIGGRVFYGASGSVGIFKPVVSGTQWSASRIKLQSGNDSIEAGWMVNPPLYSSSDPHLYAKFTAGPTECLSLQCPGFVQVSKNFPLGARPDRFTHIGDETIFYWNITIEKHPDDGNWWLSIYMASSNIQIGFWPKSLFTSLADSAAQIEWGGQINNPGDRTPDDPEMGSGIKATDDFTRSAAIFDVSVDKGVLIPGESEIYAECNDYTVYDAGTRDFWGRLIFYGGPKS
ncbi:uncharacterized protein LOC110696039 [Chenopodium quinoa]|uniref:uncharacterized protein LOC110696039 n=1 Tax=Chenopodium quinoa TaxID=63459 RepID=UPI000B791494|nr:uncharacterized protein LOC110696039 [Chenopodium quinoa]